MSDLGNKPMICSASGVECNVGRQFEGIECKGPVKVFISDGEIIEDKGSGDDEGTIRNARVRISGEFIEYCGKKIIHAILVNEAMGWPTKPRPQLGVSVIKDPEVVNTALDMFISDVEVQTGQVIFAITGHAGAEQNYVALRYRED